MHFCATIDHQSIFNLDPNWHSRTTQAFWCFSAPEPHQFPELGHDAQATDQPSKLVWAVKSISEPLVNRWSIETGINKGSEKPPHGTSGIDPGENSSSVYGESGDFCHWHASTWCMAWHSFSTRLDLAAALVINGSSLKFSVSKSAPKLASLSAVPPQS